MDLPIVNRSAILLTARQAFLDWINDCPIAITPPLTLDEINAGPTVYLIPEQEGKPNDWLEENYMVIFEEELGGRYTDESYWPDDRSYAVFRKFFGIHFSCLVVDTTSGPIVTDEVLLNFSGEIMH